MTHTVHQRKKRPRDMKRYIASDVMFLCVFLLCSGLQFTTDCTGQLPTVISCSPGESVFLSCRDINSQQTDVQWWICNSQTGVLEYSVFPLDTVKGQRYKDRVQIHSNLSLSITRLTEDDAGTYCCNTKDKKSLFHLIVEGCFMSGNEGSVISRYSGESVFLSCLIECTFRFKTDKPEFRWKLPNSREINQSMKPDELHRLYQGRFHMFNISSGNLSLQISNLTEKDEGLYSCWSNKQHKNFTITVTGCILSQHHITKSSSAGETVILPCSCEDPKTRPERFEWKRASVNETLVSDAREINGRFQMIRDSPHNLSLQISNLTETDGGLYVCSVNGGQSRVTLTLTHSAVIKSDDYQYYLIFLLCLMLLLVAGCVCWKCRRAKEGSKGSRETQRANDENDVTYAAAALNKRVQSTEDDVSYSSVTHIKGKKRSPKKQEEVVYSTMADMSSSTQNDVTYSSVAHIKSHKPKPQQKNAEEATVYASVQKDKT